MCFVIDLITMLYTSEFTYYPRSARPLLQSLSSMLQTPCAIFHHRLLFHRHCVRPSGFRQPSLLPSRFCYVPRGQTTSHTRPTVESCRSSSMPCARNVQNHISRIKQPTVGILHNILCRQAILDMVWQNHISYIQARGATVYDWGDVRTITLNEEVIWVRISYEGHFLVRLLVKLLPGCQESASDPANALHRIVGGTTPNSN